MKQAGLDVTIFSAHSTRSAAVSAAHRKYLPIEHILKTADWAAESTFAKYYNKPLEVQSSSTSFALSILES